MPTALGSGPLALQLFKTIHSGHGGSRGAVHGALLDIIANPRDAGAENVTMLVGAVNAPASQGRARKSTDVVVFHDDGPGPRDRDGDDFKPHPTMEALRHMLRPGCSTSAGNAKALGQAGVGSLSGCLALGDTVIVATHTPEHVFVLMISLPFNSTLASEGEHEAKLIELTFDKAGAVWEGDMVRQVLRQSPSRSRARTRRPTPNRPPVRRTTSLTTAPSTR